jgi:hypothetical protein
MGGKNWSQILTLLELNRLVLEAALTWGAILLARTGRGGKWIGLGAVAALALFVARQAVVVLDAARVIRVDSGVLDIKYAYII